MWPDSLIRVRSVSILAIRWPQQVSGIRTLALLTRSQGAKRGANDHRHRAAPGHVQPFSLPMNGTSGRTGRRLTTIRDCLLSSRSRVRVAVGAHTLRSRSGAIFTGPGHAVMTPTAAAVPVACPMTSR
jgi:hypothetical protein